MPPVTLTIERGDGRFAKGAKSVDAHGKSKSIPSKYSIRPTYKNFLNRKVYIDKARYYVAVCATLLMIINMTNLVWATHFEGSATESPESYSEFIGWYKFNGGFGMLAAGLFKMQKVTPDIRVKGSGSIIDPGGVIPLNGPVVHVYSMDGNRYKAVAKDQRLQFTFRIQAAVKKRGKQTRIGYAMVQIKAGGRMIKEKKFSWQPTKNNSKDVFLFDRGSVKSITLEGPPGRLLNMPDGESFATACNKRLEKESKRGYRSREQLLKEGFTIRYGRAYTASLTLFAPYRQSYWKKVDKHMPSDIHRFWKNDRRDGWIHCHPYEGPKSDVAKRKTPKRQETKKAPQTPKGVKRTPASLERRARAKQQQGLEEKPTHKPRPRKGSSKASEEKGSLIESISLKLNNSSSRIRPCPNKIRVRARINVTKPGSLEYRFIGDHEFSSSWKKLNFAKPGGRSIKFVRQHDIPEKKEDKERGSEEIIINDTGWLAIEYRIDSDSQSELQGQSKKTPYVSECQLS